MPSQTQKAMYLGFNMFLGSRSHSFYQLSSTPLTSWELSGLQPASSSSLPAIKAGPALPGSTPTGSQPSPPACSLAVWAISLTSVSHLLCPVLPHPLLPGAIQIWPLQEGLLLAFEREPVTVSGSETRGRPVRLLPGTRSGRNHQVGQIQSQSPPAGPLPKLEALSAEVSVTWMARGWVLARVPSS